MVCARNGILYYYKRSFILKYFFLADFADNANLLMLKFTEWLKFITERKFRRNDSFCSNGIYSVEIKIILTQIQQITQIC
ncbi:hypothetical protein BC749_104141 [Flavobacterium araucananum]|nr:hypothetical protein BC749_104141 [Flavobacterium araucananum]